MNCENPVFHSSIQRCETKQNNLMDLLQTKVTENENSERYFFSKNKSKNSLNGNNNRLRLQKKITKNVKTVRDVRKEYENYVMGYLLSVLDEQKHKIYSKIQSESIKSINAIKLANKILESNDPIGPTTWDMITNLNPKHFPNRKQFILQNGKNIKVRGSLGGKRTILFNYDLNNINHSIRKQTLKKRRKSLIFNSLSVNFKPGPLSKKYILDNSYQKYNIGKTELIHLPPVNLEANALYGATIEPLISNYLHSMREENGLITEKWAEFAVTSLGSIIDNKLVQNTHNTCVFNMKYKNNQSRILMRRNEIQTNNVLNTQINYNHNNKDVADEVKSVIEDILNSVDISCSEDKLDFDNDIIVESNEYKDKNKRKQQLKKLDVDVRYSLNNSENNELICRNESYCKLGCVCISISHGYQVRDHCGQEKCIFKCVCNYNILQAKNNTSKVSSEIESKLLLANKSNGKLTKEDLRFSETVVDIENKNVDILLKPYKKNEVNDLVVNKERCLRNIKIKLFPIKCNGVEPLCMVHSLYRCFCKNRYVNFHNNNIGLNQSIVQENSSTIKADDLSPEFIKMDVDQDNSVTELSSDIILKNLSEPSKFSMKIEIETLDNKSKSLDIETNIIKNVITRFKNKITSTQSMNSTVLLEETLNNSDNETCKNNKSNNECARTRIYIRKRNSHTFYASRNVKITRLESQDVKIQTRLNELINCNNKSNKNNSNLNLLEEDEKSISDEKNNFELSLHKSYKNLNNHSNLKAMLEIHYKHYKNSLINGTYNDIIKPPVKGKFGLYPWEIIMSRYKKRKNYFFVTKKNPFRMFLTVTTDNPYFINKCINVNDIRISEIHKYPTTIKTLLTEEVKAKDYFCILYGLKNCWEILGCVLKLNNDNNQEENTGLNDNSKHEENDDLCCYEEFNDNISITKEQNNLLESNIFIKQDSNKIDNKIFNAIEMTSLNIEKSSNYKSEINKLGINENEVLTNSLNSKTNGPTFVKEQEVFKTGLNNSCDSIDNSEINIIEMDNSDSDTSNIEKEIAYNSDNSNNSISKNFYNSDDSTESHVESSITQKKGLLKWFVMEIEDDLTEIRFLSKGCFIKGKSIQENVELARKMKKIVRMSIKNTPTNVLPVFGLYVTPTLKKTCILIGPYYRYDELCIEIKKKCSTTTKAIKGTWLTLRKGLNEHVLTYPLSYLDLYNIKSITSISGHTRVTLDKYKLPKIEVMSNNIKPITIHRTNKIHQYDLESKIRSLLKSSHTKLLSKVELNSKDHLILRPNNSPIPEVVISDDEDNAVDNDKLNWRRVWIECFNIENLGYILAKKNDKNELSFEFPSLIPSPFYTEDVAISKLKEVISRKIFIPEIIKPMWRIVENESEIINKQPLRRNDLDNNCVLTSKGLIKKIDVE